jgi:hypothetical protein
MLEGKDSGVGPNEVFRRRGEEEGCGLGVVWKGMLGIMKAGMSKVDVEVGDVSRCRGKLGMLKSECLMTSSSSNMSKYHKQSKIREYNGRK